MVPPPRILLRQAIQENSTEKLSEAVRINKAKNSSDNGFLVSALTTCFRQGKADLVRHLLEQEHAPVGSIKPGDLTPREGEPSFSLPLLGLLIANGWDINSEDNPGAAGRKDKLIDLVCDREDVVQWLVEHGARIDHAQEYHEMMPRVVALLETCAVFGSVSTFKYLQQKGAKLGTRTLHRSAGEAAAIGADPALEDGGAGDANAEDGDGAANPVKRRRDRAEMLRYLVDEVKLDINALDTDIALHAWHWGPPISYAAGKPQGEAVVRWLLQKGADPTIKNLQSHSDAEEVARSLNCSKTAEVISRWKREHAGEQ
ncbi:hypothetical protein B0T10DRAFT_51403 [Thelonectria olida]|uniref:Ankyrin repeat protein n=1 Tax=Thelonectria olida TaxID=1576542 RepID=A0A9P8W4U7_9HYPO|nr:hypothetical protein B0T10DRAFT_51403 [Thelonectria olida]